MKSAERKLLVATGNKGKVREYQKLLEGLPLQVVTLADEGIDTEVEETGSTIEENAILKARAYAEMSGLLTLADDSGLEVDALGGEPGAMSKRYAGPDASDEERNAYLLEKVRDVPTAKRTARFRCVIAVAVPGDGIELSQGTCEGTIAREPRGSWGFGYDPIFYVPEMGKHMAELPLEVKNRISHRARASQGARKAIERLLEQKGK